jgi:hypothetical protein
MQKRMREIVVINSMGFAASHVILTLFVGGMTFGLWYLNAFNEEALIASILQVNYFVFFLAVIWYLMIRFNAVSTLFEVYDYRAMEKAKVFIIKTRESKGEIFTKMLMTNSQIKNYRNGSNADIDELLLSIWKERRDSAVLKKIAEFEVALCSWFVARLRDYVKRNDSDISPREAETARTYNQIIEEYARASMEYEKVVSSRLQAE